MLSEKSIPFRLLIWFQSLVVGRFELSSNTLEVLTNIQQKSVNGATLFIVGVRRFMLISEIGRD